MCVCVCEDEFREGKNSGVFDFRYTLARTKSHDAHPGTVLQFVREPGLQWR